LQAELASLTGNKVLRTQLLQNKIPVFQFQGSTTRLKVEAI